MDHKLIISIYILQKIRLIILNMRYKFNLNIFLILIIKVNIKILTNFLKL